MPKSTKQDVVKESSSFKLTSVRLLIITSLIIILLLGALASAGYFYLKYQGVQKATQMGSTNEVDQLVEKVGKLIELPSGEQATLATVSDVTKLKGQVFFSKAQNGDRVLIYEQSKKAILYRPSTNKIIEVGPIQSTAKSEESVQNNENQIKVTLYNGTSTSGLTKKAEGQLVSLSSLQVDVVSKDNASSSAYAETIVIDLTGKNAKAATQIAGVVKGKVGSLPQGEKKPENSDILIILGRSYVQ